MNRRLEAAERAARAELSILEGRRRRAALRAGELAVTIERMTILSPRAGTVLHVPNWNGEKKKVGDGCWFGEKVLEVPDLARLGVQGDVDEADAGLVAEGAAVSLRLDAHPDTEFRGRIRTIQRTVQRASPQVPLKVARLSVALEKVDPEKMKPGMRIRGRVETGRSPTRPRRPVRRRRPDRSGPVRLGPEGERRPPGPGHRRPPKRRVGRDPLGPRRGLRHPQGRAVLAEGSFLVKRRLLAGLAVGGLVALALGAAALRPGTEAAVPLFVVKKASLGRTVRAEGILKAVEATPVRVPGNDVSLKVGWMIEDGTAVKTGDVVVRLDPSQTVKLLADGRAERATADRLGEKNDAESGALVANLGRDEEQARRERTTAETFQSRDPELFSRHEIIEADIDVGLATKKEHHAVSSRRERQGLATTSGELTALDGRKAQLKIDKAERELAALELKAPHDGIAVLKRNWRGDLPQVGQVVWSGQTLAEIPDLTKLEAEIWVLEADAGGLAPVAPRPSLRRLTPGRPSRRR
ncbi:MAG: HlyD family efflux transporter periplasmic adaptor subunit [Holophagales bacterium]|nr:HlyD family efflux transporter periplasmic adaptor subunit [Holophagales bacterium]